jgi:diguanylate cyclase (GGDEF)-like protein
VVLPNTDRNGSQVIADRLREDIKAITFDGFSLTVSIGVSTLSPEIINQDLLISTADRALYHAKQNGRDQVFHYADLEPSPSNLLSGDFSPFPLI